MITHCAAFVNKLENLLQAIPSEGIRLHTAT